MSDARAAELRPSPNNAAAQSGTASEGSRTGGLVGALGRVSATLASTLEREQVLETIVRASIEALGAAAGAVAELTADGTALHVVASVGYPSALVDQLARIPTTRFPAIRRLLDDGRPVLIRSQEEFEAVGGEFARLTPAAGARAALPLVTPDRCIGVLILTFAEARRFEEDERNLLSLLAQQCALTIERSRLFGEERAARREAEWASERLAEALERMSDMHFVCDAEWRYTRMNRAMREFVREAGFDADALMGQVIWDVFPRLVDGELHSAMMRAAAEGVTVQFAARGTYADSWYEGSAYPVLDSVAVHAHDMTEQRRAQREVARLTTALKQRVEEMETLLRVIPIGIGIATDAECTEILANPTLAEILGIPVAMNASKSGVQGDQLPFRVLRDGVEVPADELPLQLAARTGEPFPPSDFEILRSTGDRLTLLETAAPIFDSHGSVRGSVGAFIDVTDRKRAEESARVLSDASAAVAASTDVASTYAALAQALVPQLADVCVLFVVRDSGSVGVAAMTATADDYIAALRRFDGDYPVDATPSHPAWRAIRDRQSILVSRVSEEAIAGALSSDRPVLELARDTRTTSLLLVPVTARGEVLGAVGLGTRGTRRQFDARDTQLVEEIARRAGLALDNARLLAAEARARQEAEAAHAETERASRAKSDFLAMMSHELRTPLNAIAGYAELMEMGLRGPVTESQVTDLQKIRQSQRHLLGLINSVLAYARIESGRVMFDVENVPVDAALRTVEPLVEPQLRARGLTYGVSGCAAAVTVRADSEKLQQILLNLLGNATKFTQRGGEVALSCDVHDDRVDMHVRDTGVGVPPAQLELIFEPFVQGERPAGTSRDGVGLGLAISRELARGMGGDLTVTSVLAQGSTFTLTLPRGPDREALE